MRLAYSAVLYFLDNTIIIIKNKQYGGISNKVEGGCKGDSTVSTLAGSTPTPNKRTKSRSRWSQHQKPSAITQTKIFKGVNEKLEGKVFIIGPDQASRYDDTLKALLGYISEKCDHRVTSCIQHKDKSVGGQDLSETCCTDQTQYSRHQSNYARQGWRRMDHVPTSIEEIH